MSEQTKTDDKSSQVPSGIALVAILLSLFAIQDTVFQPTRPPMMNTERAFSEDVRSRLWQDPFQAVEEYLKQNHTQEAPNNSVMPEEISYKNENNKPVEIIFKKTENNSNGKNVLIEATDSDDTYAYEYSREPRQVCYSPDMKNDRTNSYRNSKLIVNSIEELNCQIEIETDRLQQGLHILAVMVPGGPYADDKEWRLRSRYAVIAGLTELGYTPKDPEHVDFVDFDRTCKAVLRELRSDKLHLKSDDIKELEEKTHYCHMGQFMPYEWFKNDDNETILLLWLNSSGFINTDNRTPLRTLNFLKSKIYIREDAKHRFSIIGPDGSGALKAIYLEMASLDKRHRKASDVYKALKDSSIYAATASVDQEHLNRDYAYSAKQKDISWSLWLNNKNWLDEKIIRTISTQEKLVGSLLCELALRGVTPYHINERLSSKCPMTISEEFKLEKGDSPHHIVLIGERDTYYSQKLTNSFLEAINEFDGLKPETPSDKKPKWVHTYSYLRGLDGITSEHSSNQKEEKNKKKESQDNKTNDTETREQKERPVGTSQLDYLLNLAEQIKQLDKQNAHEDGIKAIGITGSDTYDKLLILQALRKEFRSVVFFTTDLDARLFHPAEIKWTRNLLVASPFGLQLNEAFQKRTAPFRDNYQTEVASQIWTVG